MNGPVFILLIVGMTFLAVVAIVLHYSLLLRRTRSVSADDERLVDHLWQTAQRLERRVQTLETILDKESSTWREDSREHRHG